jgi:hypothetical protein
MKPARSADRSLRDLIEIKLATSTEMQLIAELVSDIETVSECMY